MRVVNLLTLCLIKKLELATRVPSHVRYDIMWLKQLYWAVFALLPNRASVNTLINELTV
jgi:hypothetical protein